MIPHLNPSLDFEDAFGTARARGAAAFLWRGRVYHTRRADEDDPLDRPAVPLVVGWIEWDGRGDATGKHVPQPANDPVFRGMPKRNPVGHPALA